MNRVRKVVTTIRNNWKKSVLFAGILSYGTSLAVERGRVRGLMRAYCEQALRFGDQSLGPLTLSRHVTVILNPEANKRKAKVQYEKYVAPILHCAGLKVSVVTTEAAGQAVDLMSIMSNTDAVLVAGGDGTLHQSITGLLNRSDGVKFPIGVIPLGVTNMSAKAIHGTSAVSQKGSKLVRDVRAIAEATLSVVEETVKQIDVLKVERGGTEQPVYSLSGLHFGLIRDILSEADKYWYLGNRMKPYIATSRKVIWKRFEDLVIDPAPDMELTRPCSGCSTCFTPAQKLTDDLPAIETGRWWSVFVPKRPKIEKMEDENREPDMSKIENRDCGVWHPVLSQSIDRRPINLLIRNDPNKKSAELIVHASDIHSPSKGSLILDSADIRNGRTPADATERIEFRDFRIRFSKSPEMESSATQKEEEVDSKEKPKEKFSQISIDNEEYDVSDMRVRRLPNAVTVYSRPYRMFRI